MAECGPSGYHYHRLTIILNKCGDCSVSVYSEAAVCRICVSVDSLRSVERPYAESA